ncbi:predicted protein [Lichtheimia corymbifera JMRC:FSU:9682]|uniref:Uncharacterized protein n=1 Tax=Lichtheimia corymbifera JMRC:FSU:9682 TaxID=1263082 RepID=A0A068S5H1_9FUNG|nr:predicted protein [Lichtheimia corymbifera JMRC:FSU:9682]
MVIGSLPPVRCYSHAMLGGHQRATFGFKKRARLAFCLGSTTLHHGFSVSSNYQRRVFTYMKKVLVRQCNFWGIIISGFDSQPVSTSMVTVLRLVLSL